MSYCEFCRIEEEYLKYELDTNLKTCSGCFKVKYCGKECQLSDWRFHKEKCNFHIKSTDSIERKRLRDYQKKMKKKDEPDTDIFLYLPSSPIHMV